MSLAQMLKGTSEIDAIAYELDKLDHATRLKQLSELSGPDQAKLYDLAAKRPCSLAADFVPADLPPLTEVIHWGYNSLAMFRSFQKRFCNPTVPHVAGACIGYNEQAMKLFTGPGYFIAREDKDDIHGLKTVVIDYTLLPTEHPAAWPNIIPNSARLSRVIYNNTFDWMWKVSKHVTVGRARRLEKGGLVWMDNWFVLCRQ